MTSLRTLTTAAALALATTAASAGAISATTGNIMWFLGGSNVQGQQNLNQGFTVDNTTTFTRTLSGLGNGGAGGATFKATIMGELDNSSEHLAAISIDGYSLGALFNGNASDDLFDNVGWNDLATDLSFQTWGDYYAFYDRNEITATVFLSEAVIAPLLADGNLSVSFRFDQDSNNYYNNTSFIRFEVLTNTATVPEPTTLLLAGGALLAAGIARRRKQV